MALKKEGGGWLFNPHFLVGGLGGCTSATARPKCTVHQKKNPLFVICLCTRPLHFSSLDGPQPLGGLWSAQACAGWGACDIVRPHRPDQHGRTKTETKLSQNRASLKNFDLPSPHMV